MFSWISKRWRSHQREIDLKILWPSCRNASRGDLAFARKAFLLHCREDDAWTKDHTDQELIDFVEKLL